MPKCLDILKKFPKLLNHLRGDLEAGPLRPTSSVEFPQKNSVLFVPDAGKLKQATSSQALLLIIDEKLKEEVQKLETSQTIFLSKNLHASMALINQEFFTPVHYKKSFNQQKGIHPNASIADNVQLGENVTIGPGVCIDEHCVIGDHVYIGANTVIEAGCSVGEGSHIFPLVFIGHDTQIGKHCKIQANCAVASDGFGYGATKKGEHLYKPHLGKVILHDRVDLGAGVYIDRGTFEDSVIGEGTKIDNNCHFGHNIVMGKHNLITGGFLAAGSVTIGDHCVMGGRATVTGHIKIVSQVMVAGLAGVSKSILKPGMYGGYPLQSLKDSLKTIASLPHLPALRKSVNKLIKDKN